MWALDLVGGGGMSWTQLSPGYVGVAPPTARKNAHAVMVDGAHFLLFGGEDGSGQLQDKYLALNIFGAFTWITLPDDGTLPSARSGGVSYGRPGWFGAGLFGGYDGAYRNDPWGYEYFGSTTGRFVQPSLAGTAPAGRAGASVTHDPANQRSLVFGGRTSATTRTNELFVRRRGGEFRVSGFEFLVRYSRARSETRVECPRTRTVRSRHRKAQ
jgi:hypothetical protein